MNICVKSVFLAGLMFALPAFGTTIAVGNLSILSDSPTPGEQQLTINNLTGASTCDPIEYTSCTSLDFTNWTLTVNYTSDYYNGGGGSAQPNPFVFTDSGSGTYGGFGDIAPSSTNNTFQFDLCAGVYPCTNVDSPDSTITSAEFSGQISPASDICLYNLSSCTTFNTTNPNFDLIWNSSSPQSPYVDEDTAPYALSPDITVTDQVTTTAVPEPGSLFLLTPLLPFARRSQKR
jgi:hypothetical protein